MRSKCVATAVILLAALAGCGQRTVLVDSTADKLSAPESELEFWQQLETRRVMTNNDALHGLLLLADGKDTAGGYDQRVEAARQRGWIKADASPPANESARVGTVAVAVCGILDIKGGVNMHLLGPTERYCTRELVYLRVLPSRTDNQSISGLEFLDLAARVEERRAAP